MVRNRTLPVLTTAVFFGLVICLCIGSAHAQPIRAQELINRAQRHDGKTVSFEGEVVGSLMKRGDGVWLNLHDGDSAIGVWAPPLLVKEIAYAGSYTAKGDWLEVTGVFYRACPVHGGDLDLHAMTIKKKMPGRPVAWPLHAGKRNYAMMLAGVVCLVLIVTRFART